MKTKRIANNYPVSMAVLEEAEAKQAFCNLLRPPATELFLDLNLPLLSMMKEITGLATEILQNHH